VALLQFLADRVPNKGEVVAAASQAARNGCPPPYSGITTGRMGAATALPPTSAEPAYNPPRSRDLGAGRGAGGGSGGAGVSTPAPAPAPAPAYPSVRTRIPATSSVGSHHTDTFGGNFATGRGPSPINYGQLPGSGAGAGAGAGPQGSARVELQAQIRALQEEAAMLEDQIQAGGMSKPKLYAVRLAGWCIRSVGGAWWSRCVRGTVRSRRSSPRYEPRESKLSALSRLPNEQHRSPPFATMK